MRRATFVVAIWLGRSTRRPRSRAIARLKASYSIFVRPARSRRRREATKTLNPANEDPLARWPRPGRPMWTMRAGSSAGVLARGRPCRAGAGQVPVPHRAGIQDAPRAGPSRIIDNGQADQGTRDVDVPLAAAHFFYYAGWADKRRIRRFGPSRGPIGVAGQIIPWNFPLLMAAWKIARRWRAGTRSFSSRPRPRH